MNISKKRKAALAKYDATKVHTLEEATQVVKQLAPLNSMQLWTSPSVWALIPARAPKWCVAL